MKQISIIALLAVLLAGCGAATARGDNGRAEDFGFLKKLGFNVSEIYKMDQKLGADYNFAPVEMNDAQQDVLLRVVGEPFRVEDDIEGVFSMIGIRALPSGYTLILYNVEFGDGASKIFAIYDGDGNTTDYLDTGYWNEAHPDESNEDYTHGTAYGDETTCTFDTPSTMKLGRKFRFFEWTSKKDAYENNMVKEFWCIDKEYDYSITQKGTFVLNDIKSQKIGPVDAEIAQLEEISDLNFVPRNDNTIFDKMNRLALREDMKRVMTNEDSQVGYRFEGVMHTLYTTKTQALLEWISNHRDLKTNALTGILERCFSSGWIPKEHLIEVFDKMPNSEAKRYLERLTAQWGPADAVG